MNSQSTIVVGVADRADSAAAVRFAVEEARRRHLGVHLVHALHPLLAGPDADLVAATPEPVLRAATDLLHAVDSDVRDALGEQAPVTSQLLVGHPAGALVDAGADAAMIVLQPARMGVAHHVPTHSVTSSVVARARTPVVAVPAGWSESGPGTVTVGVDDAGDSTHLLRAAFEEARSRGVALRVVHAWHYSMYDDVVFAGGKEEDHSDQLADKIRTELTPLTDEARDVDVDLLVHHARPADALVAESGAAALLVLGRHRTARRIGHPIGSVGRAVLRESRCPVMVVDR